LDACENILGTEGVEEESSMLGRHRWLL